MNIMISIIPTLATARNAIARLCYGRGVLLSVRLSVTLMYCVKTTQPRITKSSPCDSLESLVSDEVISVPLGEEIPIDGGHQRGYPPSEIVLYNYWLIYRENSCR